MNEIIAIFGMSGFAREVLPLVRNQATTKDQAVQIVFISKDENDPKEFCKLPVMSYEAFLALPATTKSFAIAIADSKVREKIAVQALADGLKPLSLYAQNYVEYDDVTIGEGAIFCSGSICTSNIKIGKYFHGNLLSYVAHDCTIGDYVTFAPSVCCNGNIIIEDHAYIGTGAILKQGTPDKPLVIGKGAVVGMGAVVTKSVEPNTIVVGNPAKPLNK